MSAPLKPLTSKPAAANNCFARLTAGCNWASVEIGGAAVGFRIAGQKSGRDDFKGRVKRQIILVILGAANGAIAAVD